MTRTKQLPRSSKFRALSLLVFALIIGVLGYAILFQGRAAVPPSPAIYLTPEINTHAVNTTFTVQIREKSGLVGVTAVQAAFTYPENLVELVSTNNSGSPFSYVATDTNSAGKITVGRGIAPGALPVTGDVLVTTLTFRTKTISGAASFVMTSGSDNSLIEASTFKNLLLSGGVAQGASITVDATNPTVTLSGISNAQSIGSNSTVPVTINSSDNTGVTGLEVFVDGASKGAIATTSSSYVYQWNTTGLALGNHTFRATAKDAYGNTGQSATITVSIDDKTPPTVTLSSPVTPIKGAVTLNATASDTGGSTVNRVEFYAGTTLIGQDTTTPYSVSWNTANGSFPDAPYALTARAYDNAIPQNMGTSSVINVTVENQDKTAPTAPTNLRITSVTSTSVNLAWSASTDNVGVTGYRVSRNSAQIATPTGLTYADTGRTASTTYTYSVVAFDAAGNLSSPVTVSATTATPKPCDFNDDTVIELYDLNRVLFRWGQTVPTNTDGDCNGQTGVSDGRVGIEDLGKVLAVWSR